MILETIVTGMIENNNYLLIDEKTKEAILVDCSKFEEDLLEMLDEHCANLKYVLITHGHFDHILGINKLHEVMPEVEVLAPINDKDLIEDVVGFVNTFVGNVEDVKVPYITKYIDENSEIFIGEEKIKVINTPGHTKGGVCYFVDNKLFSGDTIFEGSVGRTDLPGGSYQQLRQSVKNILEMFDDGVKIYPGHGDSTSVGFEKKYNPVL